MASAYDQLLAATVSHLEDLKSKGAKYVNANPAVLAQLATGDLGEKPVQKGSPIRRSITRPAETVVQPEAKPEPEPVVEIPNDLLVDPSVELSPERKEAEMARIRERAMGCMKCPNLANSRSNVVFGVGTIHTDLMFVGEAPGMDEDQQGEPFVGAAGQLLTKIINAMGLDRDKVYIANVLKCRPDTPGQRSGNRKPKPEEMKTCKPYLLAQISVIRPKVIIALGATAVEGLLGRPMGIMKLRGHWQDFNDTPMMPTYHPAYLLRNQSMTEKRKVWEDMLAVMEKLSMQISQKQQGFFLGR